MSDVDPDGDGSGGSRTWSDFRKPTKTFEGNIFGSNELGLSPVPEVIRSSARSDKRRLRVPGRSCL